MSEPRPVTYREAKQRIEKRLSGASIAEATWESELILCRACNISMGNLIASWGEPISDAEWAACEEILARRIRREPLQYIFGETEFMGLPFAVTPAVLIPRQDTEHLVSEALACCEGARVLDMCTGSGCIAVSIAKLGKPASVTAADISEEALTVAESNAARNGAEVAFVKSDMFAAIDGEYDVIVSNPPYIPPEQLAGLEPEVKDYEPRIALYGGEDGLAFYRVLVCEGAKHLRRPADGRKGGILIVEIGFDQGVSVPALFREAGFSEVRVEKDYAGLDRVVIGHL